MGISFLELPAVAPSPDTAPPSVKANKIEGNIGERVQLALCNPRQSQRRIERRREHRYPYPYPLYLTPQAADGSLLTSQTLVVVGKHLSECGLDFYSHQPVPHRRMIASLAQGEEHWLGFLLDLTWCRFKRHGWYENGGRFLGAVDSPLPTGSR